MTSRKCYTCKEEKPLEEFYRSKNEKYGRHGRCTTCVKTRYLSDSAKESKKAYNRARSRKSGTGFTPEEFEDKLKEQDYKCAICGTDKPTSINWHADHCHETKIKRGVLCQKCNMGIGLFNDNTELMEKAIMYLNQYKTNEVAS
jgi:hypothetical protein